MRILVIGDIHAETSWKKFADIEQLLQSNVFETEYNKYIFLGDYFDSFKITTDKMKRNFYDIIRLKKNYPDKVVLCQPTGLPQDSSVVFLMPLLLWLLGVPALAFLFYRYGVPLPKPAGNTCGHNPAHQREF